MLKIEIKDREYFDDRTSTFNVIKGQTIVLEHSLVSLAKWESKWNIPFLHTNDKTQEQIFDYIRCMTITQNVDPAIYYSLDNEQINKIMDYINSPMTATTFRKDEQKGGSKQIITAEIIYYWMISFNIPVEFQKWHLSRLLTLIRVCSVKNAPGKKMTKKDRASAMSAARKRYKKH